MELRNDFSPASPMWENDHTVMYDDPLFFDRVRTMEFMMYQRQGLGPEQAYPDYEDRKLRDLYAEWIRTPKAKAAKVNWDAYIAANP